MLKREKEKVMTENFKLVSVAQAPRTELHDQLGLTGCEVSINSLPAGAADRKSVV